MRHRMGCRGGFTLIEAMAAILIMAMAGSVLLLGAQTSLDVSDEAAKQAFAQGICEQVLDEIMSKRYMAAGEAYDQNTLTKAPSETARQMYEDTDDFNGYTKQPVCGTYEEVLGIGDDSGGARHPNFQIDSTYFRNWRLRIDIYYVSSSDLSTRLDSPPVPAGGTLTTRSGYRCAEVLVEYQGSDGSYITLATGRRVYAYIPRPTN